jgi:hypothetical protein
MATGGAASADLHEPQGQGNNALHASRCDLYSASGEIKQESGFAAAGVHLNGDWHWLQWH